MSRKYCVQCGLPIPDGQGSCCSICYGDVEHGTDGYYRRWMEEQREKEHWRDLEEEQIEEYYRDLEEQ